MLTDPEKLIALAFVSNHLTIHGRSFSADLTSEVQARAFRGLNELQHQLSSQIAAIALQSERYPDDALWNILDETAKLYGLKAHLSQSFEHARTRGVLARTDQLSVD